MCRFLSSPLSSTCSSSDSDFYFHHIIPVTFVVVVLAHMSLSSAKMTKIFAVYLHASGFPGHCQNMLSSAAVNSLGDVVAPCRTPLLVLMLFLF